MSARNNRGRQSHRSQSPWVLVVRYLLIAVWLAFTFLPLYTAFVASVTKFENLGKSFLVPVDWAWDNYLRLFTAMPFASFLRATLVYAVGTSILCIVLAVLAAYALSRFRFRGRGFFSGAVYVTQLIPQVVIVLPVFMLMNSIGLYDSFFGGVLAISATGLAFPLLLLRDFYDSIPTALDEAASVDGASRMGILVRIILPLAAPGVATAFALAFFNGWGQYLYPMVLTRSPQYTPLTVGISRMIDNQTPWELVMAGTLVSIIPAVIIYLFVQKYLTGGLTAGAVK